MVEKDKIKMQTAQSREDELKRENQQLLKENQQLKQQLESYEQRAFEKAISLSML